MMRRASSTVAATAAVALVALVALASPDVARAQEEAPRAETTAFRWAVGVNPLGIAIGRYGGDLLRFVAPHHTLSFNAHADYASRALPALEYDRQSPVWGFGGEAGWRWYSLPDATRGFFVGASVVGGWYSVDYYGYRFGLPGVGFAADMGGQADLGGDVFLAAGGGLQVLWTRSYPKDIAPGVSFVMGAGVDPRVLLTVGARIQ